MRFSSSYIFVSPRGKFRTRLTKENLAGGVSRKSALSSQVEYETSWDNIDTIDRATRNRWRRITGLRVQSAISYNPWFIKVHAIARKKTTSRLYTSHSTPPPASLSPSPTTPRTHSANARKANVSFSPIYNAWLSISVL